MLDTSIIHVVQHALATRYDGSCVAKAQWHGMCRRASQQPGYVFHWRGLQRAAANILEVCLARG